MTLPPPGLPPGGRLLNFPKKSGYQCPTCLDQPELAPNQPPGTPLAFGCVANDGIGDVPQMHFFCLKCIFRFIQQNIPELVHVPNLAAGTTDGT